MWKVSRWSVVPRDVVEVHNVVGSLDTVKAAAGEVRSWMLRRGDMPTPRALSKVSLELDDLSSNYPVLWAFLTQDTWEDGASRLLGSLLLFAQDGVIKAMARDKDRGCCLWVSAPGLRSLLDVLEAGLLSETAEWRLDRVAEMDKAKRLRKK